MSVIKGIGRNCCLVGKPRGTHNQHQTVTLSVITLKWLLERGVELLRECLGAEILSIIKKKDNWHVPKMQMKRLNRSSTYNGM